LQQSLKITKKKNSTKKVHIPFRSSKLTHLLQQTLSGDFVCSVILNVSSSPLHGQAKDALRTMQFGEGIRKLPIDPKQRKIEDGSVSNWLKGIWNSRWL